MLPLARYFVVKRIMYSYTVDKTQVNALTVLSNHSRVSCHVIHVVKGIMCTAAMEERIPSVISQLQCSITSREQKEQRIG